MQHYHGLRKGGPNAYLRVNPAAGPNDGLVQLVVKTRNNQGIGANSLAVVNYGSDYDFGIGADDSEAKVQRFRGALDHYFKRIEAANGQEAEPKAKAGGVPPPEAKAKAGEPKAKAEGAPPPVHPLLPLPGPTPLPEAKAKSKAGGVPPPESKAKATVPVPVAAGEQVLMKDVNNTGISCVYTPAGSGSVGSLWLAPAEGATSNNKLAPRANVYLLREGKLQTCDFSGGGIPYDLANPKKTFACIVQGDRSLGELKQVDKLVTELDIQKTTLYDDIQAGTCPTVLSGTGGGCGIIPTEELLRKFVQLTSGMGQVKWHWAFKYVAKDQALTPYACFLKTTRQLIIPTDARLQLN